LRAFGDQAADVAKADDAHGLAGDLAAHVVLLLPAAGARRTVGLHDVARVGQHHGDDLFGDAVGVRARRVHHVHAFFAGVFGVDRVKTRAGAHDHLELRQRVDDCGRHLLAAHDQGGGVGVRLDLLVEGRLRVLHHVVSAVRLQDLGGHGVQLGRNQNFFMLLQSLGV
jgi:hypothetical protein